MEPKTTVITDWRPEKPKTIIITGGAGFIGRHLYNSCKFLYGPKCVAILDKKHRPDWVDSRTPYWKCDIQSASKVNNLPLADEKWKFATIIHLAAEVSVASQFEGAGNYIATNCTGLFNVLRMAKKLNADKFIFASSGGVQVLRESYIGENEASPAKNIYVLTKSLGEDMVLSYKAHEMESYVLRFSNVYGPMLTPKGVIGKWVDQIVHGEGPCMIYGSGLQRRDFIYVDDIIDGILSILGGASLGPVAPGIYKMGTGCPTTIRELACLIDQALRDSSLIVAPPAFKFNPFGPVGVDHASQVWTLPDLPQALTSDFEGLTKLKEGLRVTLRESFELHT